MNPITTGSLDQSLSLIFNTNANANNWTQSQYQSYRLLSDYVSNYKEKNKQYELREDKLIIRNNIKEQSWYNYSKSKIIVNNILDEMALVKYISDNKESCVNFMIHLSFGTFSLNVCFYKNKINQMINYYIFFENNKGEKGYLAYYIMATGTQIVDTLKKIKLPEFDKIYQITGINSQIFYQYELLNFFSEIIMYYDDSGLIGDIHLGNFLPVTLNQLINKYNDYLNQKNVDNNYISKTFI